MPERLVAEGALKGRFARVNPRVHLERVGLAETLAAPVALVHALARVDDVVAMESGFLAERLAALHTQVRLFSRVGPGVRFQLAGGDVSVAAHLAHEGPVLQVVQLDMVIQG